MWSSCSSRWAATRPRRSRWPRSPSTGRRRGHAGRARPTPTSTRTARACTATSCARPPSGLATGAFGIEDPLVTLGTAGDPPGDRVRLPAPDARGAARTSTGSRAYPLRAFEEKPKPARAEELFERGRASPGTPGCSCGAGAPSAPRSALHRAASSRSSRCRRRPSLLEQAYEPIQRPLSIDYAVMEGAARNGQVVMALDGRRLDGPRVVDGAARGASARAVAGRSSSRARPSTSSGDDLVVRRVDGRLGVIAPPERGSMTAAQPIAVLRGSAPDIDLVRRAHRALRAGGG